MATAAKYFVPIQFLFPKMPVFSKNPTSVTHYFGHEGEAQIAQLSWLGVIPLHWAIIPYLTIRDAKSAAVSRGTKVLAGAKTSSSSIRFTEAELPNGISLPLLRVIIKPTISTVDTRCGCICHKNTLEVNFLDVNSTIFVHIESFHSHRQFYYFAAHFLLPA